MEWVGVGLSVVGVIVFLGGLMWSLARASEGESDFYIGGIPMAIGLALALAGVGIAVHTA